MNKTLKKTLSIILAIFMIVTSMPMAFAEDSNQCTHTDDILDGFCDACGDEMNYTKIELDVTGTVKILEAETSVIAEFTPAESGVYSISSDNNSNTDIDPYVVIYDSEGNELNNDDDIGDGDLNFNCVFQADAGSCYFIKLCSYSSNVEYDYVITKSVCAHYDEDFDGFCDYCGDELTYSEVEIDKTYTAEFLSTDEKVIVKFIPEKDGFYSVASDNSKDESIDPYVQIYNSDGTLISNDDDIGDGDLNFNCVFQAEAGSCYFIKLSTYSPNAEYDYVIAETSCVSHVDSTFDGYCDYCDAEITYSEVEIDKTYTAKFLTEDERITVKFTPEESDEYSVISDNSSNTDVDPYVKIYSSDGTLISENDDDENLNFNCVFQAEAGESYYIQLCTYYSNSENNEYNYTIIKNSGASDLEITHQPTSSEPYVEINSDLNATYQWYLVEIDYVEGTDYNFSLIEGENGSALQNPVCGNSYRCEILVSENTLYSDIFQYENHTYDENDECICGDINCLEIDKLSSQIRFGKNDDGSYSYKFDVRTRAKISEEDFERFVGATWEEATANIKKAGFVYSINPESFSMEDAKLVAMGNNVAGYTDAPINYIQDTGEYYTYTCMVTNIPEKEIAQTLVSFAYICVEIDGVEIWYFMNAQAEADFNWLYTTYIPMACEAYDWESPVYKINFDGTHLKTCEICEKEVTESHTYDENGKCVCGYEEEAFVSVSTLDEFTEAISFGGNIKLGADITLNSEFLPEKDINIDLNGHTLSASDIHSYVMNNCYEKQVSISNGTVVGQLVNSGTLTIDNCTISQAMSSLSNSKGTTTVTNSILYGYVEAWNGTVILHDDVTLNEGLSYSLWKGIYCDGGKIICHFNPEGMLYEEYAAQSVTDNGDGTWTVTKAK